MGGGIHPQRHGNDERRDNGAQRKQKRGRQMLHKRGEYVLAAHEARAHVAMQEPREPGKILLDERAVQAKLGLARVDDLLRDRDAGVFEHGRHVVAAGQLHERKRQKRDAHKDGNKLQQALCYEFAHALPRFSHRPLMTFPLADSIECYFLLVKCYSRHTQSDTPHSRRKREEIELRMKLKVRVLY